MKKIKSIIICSVFGAISYVGYFSYAYFAQNAQDELFQANIEALTRGENAHDCPGGYCTTSNSFGDVCSACCPTGKNPICLFLNGCKCE